MLHTTAYATGAAVFAAGLLEGAGVPWPGAIIVAGAAVGLDQGSAGIPVSAACFCAGYCLGSLLQYFLGRLVGHALLERLPAAQRAKVQSLTARHGTAAVLWTRPTAAGNYISIPAGMMRMPLHRFVLYTFLGIAPWAAAMAAAGWLLGGQVEAVTRWFVPIMLIACAAVGIKSLLPKLLRQRVLA